MDKFCQEVCWVMEIPLISLICPIHIAATWGLRQPWAALILTFSRKQKNVFPTMHLYTA